MIRWVFIRPGRQSPYYDPEIQEPLGLEYLAASRHRQGDPVLLLDKTLHNTGDIQVARRAVSFEPEVIGFSMTTAQEIQSVLAIHAECKRVLARRPVSSPARHLHWLAGGNFISTEPQSAQRHLPPGFKLVRCEGEKALEEVLRDGNEVAPSRVIFEGAAVQDLDTLPFPHRPFAAQIIGNEWAFNLQGSRGCCGACRYCSSPGMNDPTAKRWRGRTHTHIAEEIAALYHHLGARSFNFVDEDFLGPPPSCLQRAREFAQEIQKRKLKIAFSIQVRPNTINEDIIRCLAEAGLIFVFMGIESDDPKDFRRWGRPWSPNTWEIVEILKKYRVELNAGVMLFHSHSTYPKLRQFAQQLHRHRLLNYRTATNRLDAMPGSVFYKEAAARGEIPPGQTGPHPLPYVYPGIEVFHRDMLTALSPLGPPAMHALCSLLPLLARRTLSPTGKTETTLNRMRKILHRLDEAVAQTLFSLLDFYEQGRGEPGSVTQMQQRNLEIALEETRDLVEKGFAPSFELLREAIYMDAFGDQALGEGTLRRSYGPS